MPDCNWPGSDELMKRYHDEEWGKPNHSDKVHFEFLILEGAQAGLSWKTILQKREGYKKAFHNWDWDKVARMTEQDVERLIVSPWIIRNKLKIRSAINNAKKFVDARKEFGSFDKYLWQFTGDKVIDNRRESLKEIPAKTELSDRISEDLKRRGFTFVGLKSSTRIFKLSAL